MWLQIALLFLMALAPWDADTAPGWMKLCNSHLTER